MEKGKMSKSTYLIYETGSDYDRWQKLIFIAIPSIFLVIGLVMLLESTADAAALFAIAILEALLFHSIAPRKFQLFEDRLRIVLGKPFAFSISLATIKDIRPASSVKSHIYWGVRWATSSHNVVEIVRRRGWNMVISPSNRETFLEQVNDALKAYQQVSSTSG
jgi:hypothetical protein